MTARLSKELQSRISIKHVQFKLFNKMNLQQVLVEDRQRDTLLYAGLVQVRITDWFFFKDKAELKYVGLANAVVKLQRTDSVWNYAFLEEYFASPSTGKKQKKAGIEFNLKRVVMRNVSFLQHDAWVGKNTVARVGLLDLSANDISITRRLVDISSIDLEQPYVWFYNYDGNRPPVIMTEKGPVVTDSLLQWNPDGWTILLNKAQITKGTFKNDTGEDIPVAGNFDGQHIEFNKIDGQINNFRWDADTLRGNVALTALERSGLQVQSLKTKLRFNPQLMEFEDLYLKTNRSVVGDYFAMRYPDMASMNDFIHAVKMEARFINTSVASDDIAFFAPEIKNWNRTFQINGEVKGTVDALTGKSVSIQAGPNTSLKGDFSIVGLPNINETFFNVEANELRTTYNDAATFIPAVRRVTLPNLSKLSYVRFNGTYSGFINDFVTYGTIQTALGTLVTDLNMKLPNRSQPIYSGSIATNGFRLGTFINNSQFGNVAFNGDVRGNSFDWKTIDLTVNGTIQNIQFNNYNYRNITAKGTLKNRLFDGDFLIKDPNADLHLTGLINLSNAIPTFDVNAQVGKLDLQALGFTPNALTLGGDFNLNFSGRSVSDFLGTASIRNAILMHDGKRLFFDSLIVSSNNVNGIRTFKTRSNEFDATITGKFDLASLPDAFTHFLRRYYPAYIKHPNHAIPAQSFTFDISTGVVEDYIKLVDNRLAGFNNGHFSGSLDMASNTLRLNADMPQFSFNQYEFSDIKLTADGNYDRLIVDGEVSNAIISDSLNFPVTTFTIQAQNDVSDITVHTTANQAINEASLSAQIKTFSNGFSLLFNPSSFVLNGKTWNIEQGGELDFRNKTIVHGQTVLKESDQEIRITSHPSEEGSWNDLSIDLQKLHLGDFSPLFLGKERVEGLLTGTIRIEDPQNRFNVYSDFTTEQLRLDNDSIGGVKASLAYNHKAGTLTGNGSNDDPEHKINFDLDLNLKDSSNTHRDRITVLPVNYPVKILERFVGGIFTDLQGTLTGKLDILGKGDKRDYVGKGRLHNAGLRVLFTQVFYTIEDTEVELTENAVNLGTIKLHDRLGNTATVKGRINHRGFQDVSYDITAKVDGPPMELLNTNYNDNQTFYGRAMGTGSLNLYGPQNDLRMAINARASETDSSYITLPPSRTRESGTAEFMVERKYGREMSQVDYRGAATNIHYDINITANP
ncbi:MAG: hypothetical protein ICV84_26305, partial [Flavisolibacter sp.]|nr:hypothetical protein [Flavisolibacter sp.]